MHKKGLLVIDVYFEFLIVFKDPLCILVLLYSSFLEQPLDPVAFLTLHDGFNILLLDIHDHLVALHVLAQHGILHQEVIDEQVVVLELVD